MPVQEDFSAAGAMFRGDTPRNRLRLLSSDAVYAVSSKAANVTINSLRLDNVHEAAQKFVLKVTLEATTPPVKVSKIGSRHLAAVRCSRTLLLGNFVELTVNIAQFQNYYSPAVWFNSQFWTLWHAINVCRCVSWCRLKLPICNMQILFMWC